LVPRISAGLKGLPMLGVYLGLVLVIGLLVTGCGGTGESGGAPENVPASPEEAGEVVVRVSGAEGTAYSGTYGSIEGDLQIVDDTVGSEPTEYAVEVQEGVADGVTAGFQKIQPGPDELKVEILADDEVIVESRTFAEYGSANADWFPQLGPPEEFPTDEEIVIEDEDNNSEAGSP
jgi:hypothetical protein